MKVLQNNIKIAEIQSRFNKYSYLSKNSLPGYADARVFQSLESLKRYPDRKANPNFYHWYILMKQFSHTTTSKWISDELYIDHEDTLISDFVKLYTTVKDTLTESTQNLATESRTNKENINQYAYMIIDINVKKIEEKNLNQLRKLLEEYKTEMSEIDQKDKEQPKIIRAVCRKETANQEQMIKKIYEIFNSDVVLQIKKRIKKLANPLVSQQKTEL